MSDIEKRQIEETERKDAVEEIFQASGHPDHVEDNRDRNTEKKIDQAVKETFPASDPPGINPGAD